MSEEVENIGNEDLKGEKKRGDDGVSEGEDLPRIIVEGDRIIVLSSKDDPVGPEEGDRRGEDASLEDVLGNLERDGKYGVNVSGDGVRDKYKSVGVGEFLDLESMFRSLDVVGLEAVAEDLDSVEMESDDENKDLEGAVLGLRPQLLDVEEEKGGDFYRVGGGELHPKYDSGEPYDSGKYSEGSVKEDYEAVSDVVDVVGSVETIEEIRMGGRSMLEVVGFRDVEAEKKRRERREGNFI